MRKILMATIAAVIAMPVAMAPTPADAQSNREVRRDHRDLRDAQRDLRRAEQRGDRRDVRNARRDVRDARQDLNRSVNQRDRRWARDDWRNYRQSNRTLYARGNWRAPFRYNQWRAGARIAPNYYGQRYWIGDPGRYRLPPAGRYQRWVRHYDDVLLVDTRRGTVIRVINNFYW